MKKILEILLLSLSMIMGVFVNNAYALHTGATSNVGSTAWDAQARINTPFYPITYWPSWSCNYSMIQNGTDSYAGNKSYNIEYQVLTLPDFNAFSQEALDKDPVLNSKKAIDHLPVYIISYSNMLIPVHSGIGFKNSGNQNNSGYPGYRKGEYNVVVDATSGVPLLVFSYR